ncbi:hypothetical protein Nmel_000135, partial [Mimus melanotis]
MSTPWAHISCLECGELLPHPAVEMHPAKSPVLLTCHLMDLPYCRQQHSLGS